VTQFGIRLTERHRSRTCRASGYDAVLVLKTSWGTGPSRSAADTTSFPLLWRDRIVGRADLSSDSDEGAPLVNELGGQPVFGPAAR
jgi:hypothetical protein